MNEWINEFVTNWKNEWMNAYNGIGWLQNSRKPIVNIRHVEGML
jgi:hypothetical protein